jgi:4-hydroxy-tetrahydrodipicolinate synthase
MPAVTTPFASDGSLNRKGFQANIDRLIGLGATGVVACGCTGEFWSLTADERHMLYRDAVEAVGGRGTTIDEIFAIIGRWMLGSDCRSWSTTSREMP